MSAFPEPHVVFHIARGVDPDTKDSHGNAVATEAPGVVRRAIEIVQTASHTVQVGEHQGRQVTLLEMAVANPTLYIAGDQVVICGTATDDGYTDGLAFWVGGEPADDHQGPWPRYWKMTGGVVKLKRVG